jgi:hypothetical protein
MGTTNRGSRRAAPARQPALRRLSVFLPDDLVRRVKADAAGQGVTVSELVARWIKDETPNR